MSGEQQPNEVFPSLTARNPRGSIWSPHRPDDYLKQTNPLLTDAQRAFREVRGPSTLTRESDKFSGMPDEVLPQQDRIDAILAEVDLKRKDLERRDHEIVEEAVQNLLALGLSDHRARQIVRAHGKFRVVRP